MSTAEGTTQYQLWVTGAEIKLLQSLITELASSTLQLSVYSECLKAQVKLMEWAAKSPDSPLPS